MLRQGGEQEASSSLLGAWVTRMPRATGRGGAHLPMGPAALQTEASKQGPPRILLDLGPPACGSLSPGHPAPPRSSSGTCSIQVLSVSSPEQGRGRSGLLPA